MDNPKLLGQVGDLSQERVSSCEPESHTGTDNERGIDKTGQQEHLGLQDVDQLGLAGSGFEVLAAHDADTDTGTDSTQTNDQASGQCNTRASAQAVLATANAPC